MTYSPLALLARGEARFTGDLPLPPGTLHAMVAVSPQAHARFSRIDPAPRWPNRASSRY